MQFKRPQINKTLVSRSSYSGYSDSSRRYGNSGFWLNSDSFNDHDTAQFQGSKVDVIRLGSYLRAIKNFVRIVTNSEDISVRYDSKDNSYTDGKTVVLSSKIDDTGFDSTVGLALHEGSHCLLTDFEYTKSLFSPYSEGPVMTHPLFSEYASLDTKAMLYLSWFKDILNIVEDRRIDNYIYTNAPGYRGYYEALYDRYFRNKSIDAVLNADTYSERTFECYMFHLCNIVNPNRKLDALPGLRDIWNTLDLKNIGRLKSTQDAAALAKEIFNIILANLDDQTANGNGNGNGNGSNNGSGDDNGSSGADVNEDVNDDNGNGGGEGGEDEGPETDSAGFNESDREPLTPKQKKELEKAKEVFNQDQRNFLNGSIKKTKLTNKDSERVKAVAESNVNYQSVGGTVEGDNRQFNIGKTNAVVVHGWNDALVKAGFCNGFITSGYHYWFDNKTGAKDYSDAYYVKRIESEFNDPDNAVEAGIRLGILLGKRLKTRDEERSLKTTRLEAGKIDKRLIAELGYGNANVFSQVLHATVTPSIVHISLDASGSMGGDKWDSAIKTAVAIAKAATMISTLDVVISLRGTFSGAHYERNVPMVWVVYDSRKQNFNSMITRFKALAPNGSTPEGLCFEAILKEVIKDANGKSAYFINVSDGEPAYSGEGIHYSGDAAAYHTRKQVVTMQKSNIHILSYFVADHYTNEYTRSMFRIMYPNAATFIECSELNHLSKSLNQLFERGVE